MSLYNHEGIKDVPILFFVGVFICPINPTRVECPSKSFVSGEQLV